jgi:hypothetical protein
LANANGSPILVAVETALVEVDSWLAGGNSFYRRMVWNCFVSSAFIAMKIKRLLVLQLPSRCNGYVNRKSKILHKSLLLLQLPSRCNGCMNAGYWARGCYPDTELVYAVDNDIGSFIIIAGKKIENPGKYYAEQAAIAVNAAVIKPPMSEGKSDWNDWHISQILNTRKPD